MDVDQNIQAPFGDSGASSLQERLRILVVNAQSIDSSTKLQAVRSAREILSKNKNPPIDEFISSGIVPVLVSRTLHIPMYTLCC